MKILVSILAVGGLTLFLLGIPSSAGPESPVPGEADTGPSFDVRVEKPASARPAFGFLPERLEEWLLGGELRFHDESPGAEIGRVEPGLLELRAEGWDLALHVEDEVRVGRSTSLFLVVPLGNRELPLRCGPAERPVGWVQNFYDEQSGTKAVRFALELETCENPESGKEVDWPPAPLIAYGSFSGWPAESKG